MRKVIRRRVVLSLLFLGVAGWTNLPAGADEKLCLDPASLPANTKVVKVVELTQAQVAGIAKRLDSKVSRVTNELVSVAGAQAQINLIECETEADAEHCLANLSPPPPGRFPGRRARIVFEALSRSPMLAKRLLASASALATGTRTYRVKFRAACVQELEEEQANEVWNLVRSGAPPDESRIQALASGWKLGTALGLRTGKCPHYEASFDFAPAPVSSDVAGEVTTFAFEKLPVLAGIPYVDVSATITVSNAYEPSGGDKPGPSLTASTAAWPSAAEDVKALAQGLTAACKTDLERVVALHAHVHQSIVQKGPPGTRYGVAKVLQQGFGQCWDKSDVLVTLCRSVGVPAREVAGWVPVLNGGHVWAEVYVEGGWLPVDATAPWLGISDDYVPWFSTSDGFMPIAYLSNPSVVRQE